jgi:hypothetical protein
METIMKKLAVLIAFALALSGRSHANTFNLFGPVNGILKGSATTYITTPAAASDVYGLWSGTCDATHFLRGDGSCAIPAGTSTGTVTSVALTVPSFLSISGSPVTTSGTLAVSLSGTALPVANGGTGATTLTGPIKGNGTSAFSIAASSDIYGLWSGSCSSSTFLRGDGACSAVSGATGGTVTSVALTVPGILSISGSPITTSGTLAIGATGTSGGIPYFSSSSALASSAALTANALVLGGGAGGTPTVVGSLGTTTTLLHGNASGAPTFSAVALGSDVSGTLLAAQFPALTGDCTTSAGALATTCTKTSGVAFAASATTDTTSASNVSSGTLAAARLPSNTKVRSFGTTFGDTGGSALTSGSVVYFTIPYTCTISAWNATVDAGTVTFDVWKIATGTAIPTVANTITASALPAISTGTAKHSTTLTSWTTSVAANDIVGIQLKTVATAKYAELDIECDQ